MPFIPHTANEVDEMLRVIGAADIDELFDEIPAHMQTGRLDNTPAGVSEMQMLQRMAERAAQDEAGVCFLGAGSYDHFIPAAVWDLTARGEFMTAYTPYQAEASQGTLQLIYEYQSMITQLTAMDVSNASVYDGASGLAEALLMAARCKRKAPSRRILMSGGVHPLYQQASADIVRHQGLELDAIPCTHSGVLDVADLAAVEPPLALVLQQPNFFGNLEDVDAVTDWAAANDVLLIAVVNPLSLTLLKPPGEWGTAGADIVIGDGQPLGIPMSSGGPSFGFMCTRQQFVRQLPGRIIGRTTDTEERVGYALTLQAREQHIRRDKATSNICTNQGLLVTAATIHMSIMGNAGLTDTARASCINARALVDALCGIAGVERVFNAGYFHEALLRLPRPAGQVVAACSNMTSSVALPLQILLPRIRFGVSMTGKTACSCAPRKSARRRK